MFSPLRRAKDELDKVNKVLEEKNKKRKSILEELEYPGLSRNERVDLEGQLSRSIMDIELNREKVRKLSDEIFGEWKPKKDGS